LKKEKAKKEVDQLSVENPATSLTNQPIIV